jgi:hypothetical protein
LLLISALGRLIHRSLDTQIGSASHTLSGDLRICSPPPLPAAPRARLRVQGTCNAYSYLGPERALAADFEAFWSAHATCPGVDCGSVTVTQDTAANTISWAYQRCGSATRTYEEFFAPTATRSLATCASVAAQQHPAESRESRSEPRRPVPRASRPQGAHSHRRPLPAFLTFC